MSKRLNKIIDWMTAYKEKYNVKGVCLGLSGGKDSTVVAMLAKKVFGDNVLAVLMPNGVQADIHDSQNIAKILKLKNTTINIGPAFNQLVHTCEETGEYKISEKSKTNIAPRLRMTVLYGIAQSLGYLVIGTGNLTEYLLGWTTKFGDSASDFNPIGHLTCTEVIELGLELAEEFNLPRQYIVKKPSDGLTGKTDEDNFGFTYKEVDDYILNGKEGEHINKIKQMINWSTHKRRLPPTPVSGEF